MAKQTKKKERIAFKEAIQKNGAPDKIYCGDVDVLNKLNKSKLFKSIDKVHNEKRYKGFVVLKYKRKLIEAEFEADTSTSSE